MNMIRCGNKTRTQKEVCVMFNNKYPDHHVPQSTVSKIENKFHETGHVKQLDVLVEIEEKLNNKLSKQLAADNDVRK